MSKVIDNIEDIASIDSKSTISYVDSKPTGFKNYIINGNFDVWQRGTSQTVSDYGSDDRWFNGHNGSTKTHSQVACTDTERALFNTSKFSRTVVSSVAGAGNLVIKTQLIEDVTKLAGKTVTISFWAKADSTKNIQIMVAQVYGTGGSPSAKTFNIQPLTQLTSTWQKHTITVHIPSIVGKTLGTDGVHTSATQVYFVFDAGASWNPEITVGQQSGTFDIAQVQLEEGSVATPFEQRPYGLELSLCQRYYENSGYNLQGCISSHTPLTGPGDKPGFRFAVPKRVIPTVIIRHGVNGVLNQVYRISDAAAISVTSLEYVGTNGVTSFTLASGSANGYLLNYTASSEL